MGKERGMESWREKERQVSSDNLRRYLLPGNCLVILKLWSYYLAFVNVSVTIMGKIHDFWSRCYPLTDNFNVNISIVYLTSKDQARAINTAVFSKKFEVLESSLVNW